jgi:putative flippase GtrA
LLKQIKARLRDCFRRDPWLIAKFVAVTLALGIIGKTMLFTAVEAGDVNPTYAQFMPTLPMMVLTFLAHRNLWGYKQTSFWSHVGNHWSKSYGAQFLIGHGLFTIFVSQFGWQYLAASLVVGIASAFVTFAVNEAIVFRRRETETEMA